MVRDNYEGTPFDMMNGPEAGPFGDVIRSGPNTRITDPVNGINYDDYKATVFPNRAISIWRTAYASIAQSRASVPDQLGVTWISPNAPHHSSFAPVYASLPSTPLSLTNTTQYKFDKTKNYWVASVVGNYLSRWFKWTIEDVRVFQKSLEGEIFDAQRKVETAAIKSISKGNNKEAENILQNFQTDVGNGLVEKWWDFFFGTVVSKYRDIYKVSRPHEENFLNAPDFIGYDRWWSEMVGFWGAPGKPGPNRLPAGVPPMVYETQKTREIYDTVYPDAPNTRYYLHPTFKVEEEVQTPAATEDRITTSGPTPVPESPAGGDEVPDEENVSESTSFSPFTSSLLGYVLGVITTWLFFFCRGGRNGGQGAYQTIPDANL